MYELVTPTLFASKTEGRVSTATVVEKKKKVARRNGSGKSGAYADFLKGGLLL